VQCSLSVLLPVKDAQATLTASVHKILDVAADTNRPFEVVIVDDGSRDATAEVAHELTRHYPQIRLVRHVRPLGHDAAIDTGLQRSQGMVVVVHEGRDGFRVVERRYEFARPPSRPVRPNYLARLKAFALGE
jgi:glycosyltransferase involved in cell wall biosynthesis